MQEEPLRIQILQFLKKKEAFVYQIDIKPHFIEILESEDSRLKFKHCIEFLEHHGFIKTNGEHYKIDATVGGERYDFYKLIIKAQIQPKGEEYLKLNQQEALPVSNTYNLEGATNTIIGDNNTQSLKAHDITPGNKNIGEATSTNPVIKWILVTISAIIAGLIVWFLTK